MYFVYIIQSISDSSKTYVGCTRDMKKRFSDHNCGHTFHTAKYRPWKLLIYCAFKDKTKAYEFEKYLKSGTGRAFVAKRLL